MKFSVNWNPAAEKDLTNLWLNHPPLQRQITAAADVIDSQLRIAPENAGESRLGSLRILVVEPLLAEFKVSVDDLRVDVVAVAIWRRR